MKDIIFLYSKDAMCTDYLSVYTKSDKYAKTPNLDELAAKGTVFKNHHTAGGSTSMAFSSMLTGKNPYEFENRKTYCEVEPNEKESIFSILQSKGYECHVIWSEDYIKTAYPYVKLFGDEDKTIFHFIDMHQPLGFVSHGDTPLVEDDEKLNETLKLIFNELDSIETNKKLFVWLHLPHVLKGRIAYGEDIDVFDFILGHIRKRFSDDTIYITADHGNMNMHKGKVGYGFDVYDPITRVPLITPRINNLEINETLTSHTDLIDIILNQTIPNHDFVFCDTTYYAQPHRKLAIIGKRYKYIYNKQSDTEELYDLEWDRDENFNILKKNYYDNNRISMVNYCELYFYPYKEQALKEAEKLRKIKDDIWREPSITERLYFNLRAKCSRLIRKIKYICKKR